MRGSPSQHLFNTFPSPHCRFSHPRRAFSLPAILADSNNAAVRTGGGGGGSSGGGGGSISADDTDLSEFSGLVEDGIRGAGEAESGRVGEEAPAAAAEGHVTSDLTGRVTSVLGLFAGGARAKADARRCGSVCSGLGRHEDIARARDRAAAKLPDGDSPLAEVHRPGSESCPWDPGSESCPWDPGSESCPSSAMALTSSPIHSIAIHSIAITATSVTSPPPLSPRRPSPPYPSPSLPDVMFLHLPPNRLLTPDHPTTDHPPSLFSAIRAWPGPFSTRRIILGSEIPITPYPGSAVNGHRDGG